jgi:SAM-dependent methyltransferase
MLRAGFNVVVVEPSKRMVSAMVRNCLMNAGKIPEHYNAAAENLSEIANGRFDIVLLECVFGFVGDKDAAVSEILRVLKPNGIVAVTDFHYTETPPGELQSQLRDMFGLREIMVRSDWESYFDAFGLDAWRDVPMGTGGIDAHSIELMLSDAKLLDTFPGGRKAIGEFATRFIEWENIFTANRKYMAGHNALWRKPAIAV